MKARNLYEFGKSSSDRLNTTSPFLQATARKAIMCSPIDFSVPWMGGLRSAAEQNAIFKEGNSKCDGYDRKSNHQIVDDLGKCMALDLVPYIKGVGISYDADSRSGIIGMLMLESWEELQDEGVIPNDKYLHWGGFWSNSSAKEIGWDIYHFEIRDSPQVINLRN